jgi:hypothetical protein
MVHVYHLFLVNWKKFEMRCKGCCKKLNYVVIKIIDEDSDLTPLANKFRSVMTSNELDSTKTIFSETAQYLNDFHQNNDVPEFLGFVLVPVFNVTVAHSVMLERFQEFYDSLEGIAKEKTIILDVVQRENDYSDQLISAIESFRQNPENEEESLPLDYIITLIDDSGSHDIEDFGPSFLNFYRQYSSEQNIQTVENLLSLSGNNNGNLLREIVTGEFINYGLNRGIGTKHIIVSGVGESSEKWITEIIYATFKIGIDLSNNWEVNCEKLCKYRWTTYNNLYLIPFFPTFLNQDPRILNYIDPQDLEPDLNLYDYIYNSTSSSREFDIQSNWPEESSMTQPYFWDSVAYKFPNNPFAENGTYNGQLYGFNPQLISLTGNARSLGFQSCPCWMFEPVKNYVRIISE